MKGIGQAKHGLYHLLNEPVEKRLSQGWEGLMREEKNNTKRRKSALCLVEEKEVAK